MCRKGLDFEIKSWTNLQKFLLKKNDNNATIKS